MVLMVNDNLFRLSHLLIGIFFCEMFTSEDIGLAGGGDEYVTPVTAILTVATSYVMAAGRALIWFISMMITLQPKPLRD